MTDRPRVSVITIFLDEERFLEEAVQSVLAQTYREWELLLCDDGSTDGSTAIARRYADGDPRVRYLEHEGHRNRGMSATRNLGLRHARSELIAWLDADDAWMPRKLERQVQLLDRHSEAAMVYGPVLVWYGWTGKPADRRRDFVQPLGVAPDTLVRPPELLTRFLQDDVHTPAGELIRRSVLEDVGGFDESFRGMYEDGIVQAKVCLERPVYAAGECWYKYRQHPDSCCRRSIEAGTDSAARLAFLSWLRGYLNERGEGDSETARVVRRLLRSDPAAREGGLSVRLGDAVRRTLRRARKVADRAVPAPVRRGAGLLAYRGTGVPPSGWVHLGNLRRVSPISRMFGYDRGSPVDRYYIETFLEAHASDIRGRVLEVADRDYTRRFGGDRVVRSDVLHAEPGNPEATIVGDLCTGKNIPERAYDCIILTQVLPFLWDFKTAIANARRALKPGGVLLATLPGISQISRFDASRWGDYWRFTSMSATRLFGAAFGPDRIEVTAQGNVLAATALLYGLAREELRIDELAHRDSDYEVTVAVRAVRDAGDLRAGGDRPGKTT
jgi:glycosyltransferase involved in cell wall biosynthesis/SAM-dependent methyltransferase